MEVELPIQNMRLVAISEIFIAQTGSMCYNIEIIDNASCHLCTTIFQIVLAETQTQSLRYKILRRINHFQ